MTLEAALTLAAIIVGPIIAVVITRFMDRRQIVNERRLAVFRDLVRTRSAKLSQEHVQALNLVEIEFSDVPSVKTTWQSYMENLSSDPGPDKTSFENHISRRQQLFVQLVQKVANASGIKIDATEIMLSNYYPQGWQNEEEEQRQVRQLLIGTLSGMSPLPIKTVLHTEQNGPFPAFPAMVAPAQPKSEEKKEADQ